VPKSQPTLTQHTLSASNVSNMTRSSASHSIWNEARRIPAPLRVSMHLSETKSSRPKKQTRVVRGKNRVEWGRKAPKGPLRSAILVDLDKILRDCGGVWGNPIPWRGIGGILWIGIEADEGIRAGGRRAAGQLGRTRAWIFICGEHAMASITARHGVRPSCCHVGVP
jgi:hypothetical protein